MERRLSNKIIITVALLGFSAELAWAVENQFFNLFIYNEIAPVPMYVSLMVAASAITATLTAIFLGALSDKLGRRKVFFLIGFPLWAITTAMFPLAGLLSPVLLAITVAITFDCIMTFFGSMASDAALSAYITDVTTVSNRGILNSIREFGLLIAILMTYGVSGFIIEAFGYYIFFYIVSAIVGILGTIGAIIAPEPELASKESYWENIKQTFSIDDLKSNEDCFLVLTAAMIWSIGFNVVFPFLLIFVEHYLGYPLIEASIIVAIALVVSLIAAIPMGLLTDKLGRKVIILIAIIIESTSLIGFAIITDYLLLIVIATGLLLGMTLFDVSIKTWTKDLYPEDRRGQFSGYFILFTVLGGMVIGPMIGGFIAEQFGSPIVIDGIPGFIPPPMIFIVAAIVLLFTIIPVIKAKDISSA